MAGNKGNIDIAHDLVHLGERGAASPGQPTSTPIYASSTYTYESMEEIDKVFAGGAARLHLHALCKSDHRPRLEEAIRAN